MGGKRAADGGRGGGQPKRPRRNKAKYLASGRKPYTAHGIPPGVEGFLVTCMAGKEYASAREVINVLDQFWDESTGGAGSQSQRASEDSGVPRLDAVDATPEEGRGGEENEGEGDREEEDEEEGEEEEEEEEGEDGEARTVASARNAQGSGLRAGAGDGLGGGDIDKLLEAEMEGIRTKKKVRFSFSDTGCKGLVFIRHNKAASNPGPGPSQLAESVVRQTFETKRTRTRYTMKLLPAEVTCYPSIPEIERAIGPILERHFPAGADAGTKYAIVVEGRAHGNLDRMAIIKAVAALVPAPHAVDLSSPQKTILVQVVKTSCTLGVVNDFKVLAKYNLRQIVCPDDGQPKRMDGSTIQTQSSSRAENPNSKSGDAIPSSSSKSPSSVAENPSSGVGSSGPVTENPSTCVANPDAAPEAPGSQIQPPQDEEQTENR